MFYLKTSSNSWLALCLIVATIGSYACSSSKPQTPTKQTVTATAPPRVLVFSKTKGWKHTSIPFGNAAIQKLGKENGFLVDTTKNAAYFTDDSLRHYDEVVFNCTT
jgi:cytochrome c